MADTRHIVLLFENGDIREESVRYAIGISQRMEKGLLVLMVGGDGEKSGSFGRGNLLAAVLEAVRGKGIEVSVDARKGDSASEFLKFLAGIPPPAAIVWGSGEEAMSGGRRGKSGHWLKRVAGGLCCPVIVPTKRKT
jgi:hypothetical protein